MVTQDSIDIVYDGGTFGKTLIWCIDRFHKDCKFKNLTTPWIKSMDDGVVDISLSAFEKNPMFKQRHQFVITDDHSKGDFNIPSVKYIPNTKNVIVINYPIEDIFTVQRYQLTRTPTHPTSTETVKYLVTDSDRQFISENFGETQTHHNDTVLKELIKKRLHSMNTNNYQLWIEEFMNNSQYYQFPLDSMYDVEMFSLQLEKISERFGLGLQIDKGILKNVVDHINLLHVVKTRNRVKQIIDAVCNDRNSIDCKDCDIIEQAAIEVKLEQRYNKVIFPYGTNWFSTSDQIYNFVETYPQYLKNMHKKLPWVELTKSKYEYTIEETVEATKSIKPEIW